MPDGSDFDGEQLLTLVRGGNSPFQRVWDVNLLIQEIEETLGFRVIDIPNVDKGSNYYVSFCFTIFFSPNPIQNAETELFGRRTRASISNSRISPISSPAYLVAT